MIAAGACSQRAPAQGLGWQRHCVGLLLLLLPAAGSALRTFASLIRRIERAFNGLANNCVQI